MGKKYTEAGMLQTQYMTVTDATPLDDRFVVNTRADLLNENTWSVYGDLCTYSGMIVSVVDDPVLENNGVYYLRRSSKYNKQTWDTSAFDYDIEGWKQILGGASPSPIQSDIYLDQSINNEESFPGSFGGEGTQNNPYYVSTINGGEFVSQ